MNVAEIELSDFRGYTHLQIGLPVDGVTLIIGDNGQGKTNLLEAIGYAATLRSLRGSATDSLVKVGAERAIVRCSGSRDDRSILVETEIRLAGRNRTLLNKQPVRRSDDLAEGFVVSVFAPDDLELVKAGPVSRRAYLDELLAGPDRRMAALQADLDRVLRQRNTLLRQAGGRLTADISLTLDVWDEKFADLGERQALARTELIGRLQPYIVDAYRDLAAVTDGNARVGLRYVADWRLDDGGKGLRDTLAAVRQQDVARGVTTVGPHRDEVEISINGMSSRSQASQGEQRTLALALRLAGHRYLADDLGAPPVLLLDDVFSELDLHRTRRLVESLPQGQVLLTATDPPHGVVAGATLHVEDHQVRR